MASGEVQHPYHLVNPSPWPLVGTVAAFVLVLGLLFVMRGITGGAVLLVLGIGLVAFTMAAWWRDVLKESKGGYHTLPVAKGLRLGMALFITSEVLFFFAFFWAFFWAALDPSEAIGSIWPPETIEPIGAWGIPLLNTLILLLSGVTLTWAHHAVLENRQDWAFRALLVTVALGVVFLFFQIYEYQHATFTLSDTVYGSTFYMATGFHGFHVFVGAVFLIVCTARAYKLAFTPTKHVGFEAAAWYWHFVDVVWLFLFVCVYVWGNSVTV
ncbi:MAG: cytochrome c oxidase subunit 3 [Geminicoccaceae bacterium]